MYNLILTALAEKSLIEKSINIVVKYHKILLIGIRNTVIVALLGTIFGLVIGLFIGAIRAICVNHYFKDKKSTVIFKKIIYFITSIYVEVLRGTPMMVQAMFFYWCFKKIINWNEMQAAISIISVNTGAYMAEIIRSGIQSVDKGQTEGARCIGMNAMQTMRYVIMPQAIKNSFPSIGNEFVVNLKDSCVLNCIGFAELFFQAKSIAGSYFDYTGAFFVVGVIYFILTFITTTCLKYIEKRMNHTTSSYPASQTMPKGGN